MGNKKAKRREKVVALKTVRSPSPPQGKIRFAFTFFDGERRWCAGCKSHARFFEIAKKLKSYESMSWEEIKSRDHPVEMSKLIPEARERLKKLRLEEFGDLWRLRFDGKTRLWG